MKRSNILIALACLILPGLLTSAWYYSGFPKTNSPEMPAFESIEIPRPPLSTAIPLKMPPSNPKANILVDMSHGNLISLSEIDPLIRAIESLGGSIGITTMEYDLKASLKKTNAFVTLAPLQSFTPEDIASITSFVERGGILVVASDPTRNTMVSDILPTGMALGGVDIANMLLEPFDTSITDDYLYDLVSNEGNYRNVIFNDFDRHQLTQNINKLVIYGGHSVNSHEYPLASSSKSTYSSTTDMPGDFSPFALVKHGKGSVLAMGDLSLLTSQYALSADNQVFINNLAAFVTENERTRTLEDFPVLFDSNVTLIPGSKMDISSDLISIISKLEKTIFKQSGELSISNNGTNQYGNRIYLTTYEPDEKAEEILTNLGVDLSPPPVEKPSTTNEPPKDKPADSSEMDESDPVYNGEEDQTTDFSTETEPPLPDNNEGPERIGLPGLGVISTGELGLVGLVREGEEVTLVIATSTDSAMNDFITELSINGLNNCLVKEDLAACSIYGSELVPQG